MGQNLQHTLIFRENRSYKSFEAPKFNRLEAPATSVKRLNLSLPVTHVLLNPSISFIMDVADNQRPPKVVDSTCEVVRDLFATFLEEYVSITSISLFSFIRLTNMFLSDFYNLIATLQMTA